MRKIEWNGLLIVSGLLFSLPAFSQQTWIRNYGGAGDDLGLSVQQTSDGGYIVTGYTNSFGNGNQVYLIKTNASGDTLWTKTYGGTRDDGGYSVQQTQDGSYIVAGYTNSFGSGSQVYFIKTNASGDTLWTRAYGGARDDAGFSVQQTQDMGYIVAGRTISFGDSFQVYLIKTNTLGDTLWTRAYGGADWDEGFSVQQTQDTGYIIAGYSRSIAQVYLIKTNARGDTLWTRHYGGAGDDGGRAVLQTQDGGFIVVGWSFSLGNFNQVYLIKTNAGGDTLWTRTYGGTDNEVGYSVRQTQDGGFIIAGYTWSFGNGSQVYLIKTNASGDTLWTRTYGGASLDGGWSVQQTSDGGYIIAGGTISFGDTLGDVYLIKTDANGNVGVEVSPSHESRVTSYKATPNPFTSFARVLGHSSDRFALYDISGRKVGSYMGDRIGFDLSSGIYFLKPGSQDAKLLRIVKLK